MFLSFTSYCVQTDDIVVRSRDFATIFRSGQLDQWTALRTIEYLENENEDVPFSTALSELNYVRRMLKKTATFGAFRVGSADLGLLIFLQNQFGPSPFLFRKNRKLADEVSYLALTD